MPFVVKVAQGHPLDLNEIYFPLMQYIRHIKHELKIHSFAQWKLFTKVLLQYSCMWLVANSGMERFYVVNYTIIIPQFCITYELTYWWWWFWWNVMLGRFSYNLFECNIQTVFCVCGSQPWGFCMFRGLISG